MARRIDLPCSRYCIGKFLCFVLTLRTVYLQPIGSTQQQQVMRHDYCQQFCLGDPALIVPGFSQVYCNCNPRRYSHTPQNTNIRHHPFHLNGPSRRSHKEMHHLSTYKPDDYFGQRSTALNKLSQYESWTPRDSFRTWPSHSLETVNNKPQGQISLGRNQRNQRRYNFFGNHNFQQARNNNPYIAPLYSTHYYPELSNMQYQTPAQEYYPQKEIIYTPSEDFTEFSPNNGKEVILDIGVQYDPKITTSSKTMSMDITKIVTDLIDSLTLLDNNQYFKTCVNYYDALAQESIKQIQLQKTSENNEKQGLKNVLEVQRSANQPNEFINKCNSVVNFHSNVQETTPMNKLLLGDITYASSTKFKTQVIPIHKSNKVDFVQNILNMEIIKKPSSYYQNSRTNDDENILNSGYTISTTMQPEYLLSKENNYGINNEKGTSQTLSSIAATDNKLSLSLTKPNAPNIKEIKNGSNKIFEKASSKMQNYETFSTQGMTTDQTTDYLLSKENNYGMYDKIDKIKSDTGEISQYPNEFIPEFRTRKGSLQDNIFNTITDSMTTTQPTTTLQNHDLDENNMTSECSTNHIGESDSLAKETNKLAEEGIFEKKTKNYDSSLITENYKTLQHNNILEQPEALILNENDDKIDDGDDDSEKQSSNTKIKNNENSSNLLEDPLDDNDKSQTPHYTSIESMESTTKPLAVLESNMSTQQNWIEENGQLESRTDPISGIYAKITSLDFQESSDESNNNLFERSSKSSAKPQTSLNVHGNINPNKNNQTSIEITTTQTVAVQYPSILTDELTIKNMTDKTEQYTTNIDQNMDSENMLSTPSSLLNASNEPHKEAILSSSRNFKPAKELLELEKLTNNHAEDNIDMLKENIKPTVSPLATENTNTLHNIQYQFIPIKETNVHVMENAGSQITNVQKHSEINNSKSNIATILNRIPRRQSMSFQEDKKKLRRPIQDEDISKPQIIKIQKENIVAVTTPQIISDSNTKSTYTLENQEIISSLRDNENDTGTVPEEIKNPTSYKRSAEKDPGSKNTDYFLEEILTKEAKIKDGTAQTASLGKNIKNLPVLKTPSTKPSQYKPSSNQNIFSESEMNSFLVNTTLNSEDYNNVTINAYNEKTSESYNLNSSTLDDFLETNITNRKANSKNTNSENPLEYHSLHPGLQGVALSEKNINKANNLNDSPTNTMEPIGENEKIEDTFQLAEGSYKINETVLNLLKGAQDFPQSQQILVGQNTNDKSLFQTQQSLLQESSEYNFPDNLPEQSDTETVFKQDIYNDFTTNVDNTVADIYLAQWPRLKGRIYFVSDNVKMPLNFIQDVNGNIEIGFDGLKVCKDQLNKGVPVSYLLNAICKSIHKGTEET